MKIINETKEPASEYAPLGLNLLLGCTYGCRYCYGPETLHRSKQRFYNEPELKKDALGRLEKDAEKLAGDEREILMSFVSDPYQPVEERTRITRKAILILMRYRLRFTVLTKGGMSAVRDFALLEDYDRASFGTSIAFTNENDAGRWEPEAASVRDRMKAIEKANTLGIRTWISLDPVTKPEQALELVKILHPIVNHWKIGNIFHRHSPIRRKGWGAFREEVTALLDDLGADYYVKRRLATA